MFSKNVLTAYSFKFLLATLILVPASGMLQIKIASILLFLLTFILVRKFKFKKDELFVFTVLSLMFIVAALNTLVYWRFKEDVMVFLPTILIISVIILTGRAECLMKSSVVHLRYCYSLSIVLAIVKLMIIITPLVGLISGKSIVAFFENNFPGVSSQLFWGNEKFVRVSLLNELMLSFSFLLGLIFIRKGYFKSKIYLIFQTILFVACIVSFQRFIWLYISCVFIFHLILYSKKAPVYILFTILIFLSSVAKMEHSSDGSSKSVLDVLMIKVNDSSSLDTKSLQAKKIMEYFSSAPILGHGLTAYVPNYTRSEYKPYVYEFQFGTLLVQLGIVGTLLYLFFFFIFPYFTFVKRKINKDTLLISFSFMMLFLSSFINPYLLSVSAVPFFLFHYFMLWENKHGS